MLILLTDSVFHASINKNNNLAYVTHRAVYTQRKYSCRRLKILKHHTAAAWERCAMDSETFPVFLLYYSFNNSAAVCALLACAW